MKQEFSWQIIEYSYIRFTENLSFGSRAVPCGGVYKYEEADSRFSQFFERA